MEEKKLKCKMSTFQTDMSFNEWVRAYRVSSQYIEPTKYYQGNAGSVRITMDTKMEYMNFKTTQTADQSILSGIKDSILDIIYKKQTSNG
jgi:uncharacterized membrane protein affecting hemolysin expression